MTILRTLLLVAGIALFASSARADTKSEGFGELTLDQVSSLVSKHEADVFDNNDQDTYARGHVPTAKWVSFKDVKATDLPADKSRKLVFYCANTH